MLIGYFRGEPTVHVIRYRDGEIAAHGAGISFWYWPMNTAVAAVPTVSQEARFIFNETTADFQEVAIQGSLAYRITAPLAVAERVDFRIDPAGGRFLSDGPDRLSQRVVDAIQAATRTRINGLSLEGALKAVRVLAAEVYAEVEPAPALADLGVALESLHFVSVKATPEMQKALEADYRESLQQRADQAIYARRAAAVDEERRIRESELDTEVELEQRRQELVDTQARNNLTLAEADAKAEELRLNPYGEMRPEALVALALKEWAGNAGTIENLSITPDLLSKVVGWVGAAGGATRQ